MTDDEVDIEIPLRIESDNDLYNKLDPTRSTIDDSVYDYMFEKMSDIRRGERVRVNVFSAQKLDEERVRKAFMDNLDDHLAKLHRERMTNRMNQARLFIIGIAFISFWLTASAYLDGIWPEVLSIIGSFSVWEAANIWIKDNPSLKYRRLKVERLKDAEINFIYDSA